MAFEIFDVVMARLQHKMKLSSAAHEATVHNIANASSKDYVPLKFDEELEKVVRRQDGGGVVLEDEMIDLEKHSGGYGAYVKLLMMKLSNLRTIATQGRK